MLGDGPSLRSVHAGPWPATRALPTRPHACWTRTGGGRAPSGVKVTHSCAAPAENTSCSLPALPLPFHRAAISSSGSHAGPWRRRARRLSASSCANPPDSTSFVNALLPPATQDRGGGCQCGGDGAARPTRLPCVSGRTLPCTPPHLAARHAHVPQGAYPACIMKGRTSRTWLARQLLLRTCTAFLLHQQSGPNPARPSRSAL